MPRAQAGIWLPGPNTAATPAASSAGTSAGGHRLLVPELIDALREQGRPDILVTVGGVVPPADVPVLEAAGVAAVFGPGSQIPACALGILDRLEGVARAA